MRAHDPVVLGLPFRGTWLARNSPARRVPSHGTDLFATTYAIDFIAVRQRRTATTWDWRTLVATEPPERFHAFGQPVVAPAAGTVARIHDGEPDHAAARSQPARLAYALTQARRARAGAGALAGNHVILQLARREVFVVLAHLRAGSLHIGEGDAVDAGQQLATCGNSGNSTQPHVHVQAMDSLDPMTARGLPLAFSDYQVHPRRGGAATPVDVGMPGESQVVAPR